MNEHLDRPPQIFERRLARLRLQRAARQGSAEFLLARVVDDAIDRVSVVSRRFPLAVEIGAAGPLAADRLLASGRIDSVIRVAPAGARTGDLRLALVGDAEALPLGRARFDLAVSLLALQGTNDPLGALIQIRQSLKPDGLFLGCMAGGDSLFELREALAVAEADIDGGVSPRVAPFARVQDVSGLLQRAGFVMPVVDVDTVVVRYSRLIGLMHDLRAMGATNTLRERRRTPLRRAVLARAAQVYAERHADADGRLRATCDLIWLLGWVPDPSQPQARSGARRQLP